MGDTNGQILILPIVGIAVGLFLLWRGFGGYRTAMRITDIATSRIGSMAAGEVRVTGVVESAEILLTSALQSVPCVYYRSTVKDTSGDSDTTIHDEERAIGFRVRDDSGGVRIFPHGALWEVPTRYEDRSSRSHGPAAGLNLRTGSPYQLAEPDRETLIADLLTPDRPLDAGSPLYGTDGSNRQYIEARVEPGDTVTIIGRAMPFAHLADPSEANIGGSAVVPADDPEVAMNIAEARAAGLLVADPALAWGNAAIPGFGIGAPVRQPVLDPQANRLALAPPESATQNARTFDIDPDQLVVASGAEPLIVALGSPGMAAARQRDTFLIGLLGVVLAIGSAIVLAFAIAPGGMP